MSGAVLVAEGRAALRRVFGHVALSACQARFEERFFSDPARVSQ